MSTLYKTGGSLLVLLCILTGSFAQEINLYNQEAIDKNGNLILLGKSSRDRLAAAPFDQWYQANYDDYVVDKQLADSIKPLLRDKQLMIFMGTWCGDSRREVPRIFKILDCCGIDSSRITLINVNNHDTAYKQSPQHEEHGLDIRRVPDLLVMKDGKEIGRIVETPVISWERDLLTILKGRAYTPHYARPAETQTSGNGQ